MKSRISRKAESFTESVIREMTRLSNQHGAVNLSQGFPDFPAPSALKQAASAAIFDDINQYAVTWGAPGFRRAIARKHQEFYDWPVDPEGEITVACGATECMIAAVLAVVDPGHKVLIVEPFYENYGPDTILAQADPVYISLDPSRGWALDFDEMDSVLQRHAGQGGIRAMILNSPHNPTGKAFSRSELERIAELACRYDFYVITDEIYEHILYDGRRHHPIALFPGMRRRTITINGMSKTYSVTGWRVGYIVAPEDISNAVRKVHDFLTVGAAAPLQEAGIRAMQMPREYYSRLAEDYQQRRDFLLPVLKDCGFEVQAPEGAYYIMAGIAGLTDEDDVTFARRLVRDYGVATVPGSSFYHDPRHGSRHVRFAFCKTLDMLEQAAERLAKLRA